MISINDIKSPIMLKKELYEVADKLLMYIDEHANTNIEIDNVTVIDIADTYAFLQEQKLIRFAAPQYDISIPSGVVPRLNSEGHSAKKLGIKKYIKRRNCKRWALITLFVILLISSLTSTIVTLIRE